MKLKKILASLVSVLVLCGTTVFAAGENITIEPVTYVANSGEVTVVVSAEGITNLDAMSMFQINFDKNVFTFDADNTVGADVSTINGKTGYVQWKVENDEDLTGVTTLAEFKFTVNDNQEANVVGSVFSFKSVIMEYYDGGIEYTAGGSQTVTAAAPAGTSTKTVYAEETYALSNETFDFGSTYDFAKKWNVVVKYNNTETKTYGWSWKNNLGIEGEGTVTGKVKFGVKISDTSKYDATLFTFDLVEVQ